MNRTLRDCLNLLTSNYVSGWSLLLLPALLSLAIVPSSTSTTTALLLRFLGLGVALIPLARVISQLVDYLSDHLGDRYSGVVARTRLWSWW